jgi:hypothetical protein
VLAEAHYTIGALLLVQSNHFNLKLLLPLLNFHLEVEDLFVCEDVFFMGRNGGHLNAVDVELGLSFLGEACIFFFLYYRYS